jgi:Mce-associated membrane protein
MDNPSPASRRIVTIVMSVALVAAVSLAIVAWWAAHTAAAIDRARTDALAAAGAATQAVFSYDYRGFDASVANGRQFVTGDFAAEYAQTTATLAPAASRERAIVRAEVSSAGVVRASPDEVEVLLYVNQYRRNANIDGEKVDQNRVVLTLTRTADGWKVSHALAI